MKICHCWKCALGSEGNFQREVQKCVWLLTRCLPASSNPPHSQKHLQDPASVKHPLTAWDTAKLLERDVYTEHPPFIFHLPPTPQLTTICSGSQSHWNNSWNSQKTKKMTWAKCSDFCWSFVLANLPAAEHRAAYPCLELVTNCAFSFSLTLLISSFLHLHPTFS